MNRIPRLRSGLFAAMIVAVFLVLPTITIAQTAPPDIITRPTKALAPWRALTASEGAVPTAVCLFSCGADHLLAASHVVCAPADGLNATVAGEVANPYGAGDACYRAVSVTSDGKISEPSENQVTILDIPLPPVLLELAANANIA